MNNHMNNGIYKYKVNWFLSQKHAYNIHSRLFLSAQLWC